MRPERGGERERGRERERGKGLKIWPPERRDTLACEGRRVRTAGEQADIEQRLVAELRRVAAQHGFRTPKPHAFVPEPADQPEEFTMTLQGVTAEVAGQKR